MSRRPNWLSWRGASSVFNALSAGLLLSAAGCVADSDQGGGKDRPASETQLRGTKTSLLRATSCEDLLTKIQDDAIAKLDLSVALAKTRWSDQSKGDDDINEGAPPSSGVGISSPGSVDFGGLIPRDATGGVATGATNPVSPTPAPTGAPTIGGGAGGTTGSSSEPGLNAGTGQNAGGSSVEADSDPTGASDTNTQVEGVDEADFVKLVDSGRGMFLLHGNTLRKLKTYPPQQLSLEPPELKIEGQPSELFVTDQGRAVIFSTVYGYPTSGGSSGDVGSNPIPAGKPFFPGDVSCDFGGCGGGDFWGYGGTTKITIADVSGDTLSASRELYFSGSYISSRRHSDIVRVVLQSERSYDNLFEPEIDGYDPWGRPYADEVIDEQLAQWRDRIAASVRNTKLEDWLPQAKEIKAGALVNVAPDCDSYFVPQPGFADSGLVQVLSIDVSNSDAAVGGVSVMGRASTVYSSLDRLVLAQPDYRWLDQGASDFGFIDEQRTTLHAFALTADKTTYLASGFVPGHLPQQNAQFGIDVSEGHTVRIATSGRVRKNPDAAPNSNEFWQTDTENLVLTLHEDGAQLKIVGKSSPLGHMGETVQSARFVGDRAYVVTFRQTDPLIVLDVSNDGEPVVLGEIEIPGFSQYMHPLDENHLITFGRSGNGGSQLQLFDVTDPLQIPQPKTLDFGGGSSSETAFNHKAFTFYAPLGLIALPVTANRLNNGIYTYTSALRVIHVDAEQGFELLGSVDHSAFVDTSFGCIQCSSRGCSQQCFAGSPEVRRGHFVESSAATYVYAIGYGGVTVSDLETLATPIASVKLPGLTVSSAPWYGVSGFTSPSSGGFGGSSGSVGVTDAVAVPAPPSSGIMLPARPVEPQARDAGAPPAPIDGGVATSADAG